MARRKRRRMAGISADDAARVCATHYRGNAVKVKVCQDTARSLIKKIVANKHAVCSKWCGCR